MTDMRELIREQTSLAQTYADDGAYHSAGGVLRQLTEAIEAHAAYVDHELAKMTGGPTINNVDERLRDGEGTLWEVSVERSYYDGGSVDFTVRAKTEGEAISKAEEEARRFPKFYFGETPDADYEAPYAEPVEEEGV